MAHDGAVEPWPWRLLAGALGVLAVGLAAVSALLVAAVPEGAGYAALAASVVLAVTLVARSN